MKLFNFFKRNKKLESENRISVEDMAKKVFGLSESSNFNSIFNGDDFDGGFGDTKLYSVDYWTLRKRSAQLFKENIYAFTVIERLVQNEIGAGLMPEAKPIMNMVQSLKNNDDFHDWTKTVESSFFLWQSTPELCDYEGERNFGQLQAHVKQEAYIEGDILVIERFSKKYKVPQVQLISGSCVESPSILSDYKISENHSVKYGVELDNNNKVVSYFIKQKDSNKYKRILAHDPKTNRRVAYLVFGSKRRQGEVRGQPILSNVLQSLKELDRYRAAAQRKAVVNSLFAVFIKRNKEVSSKSKPIANTAAISKIKGKDIEKTQYADGTETQRRRYPAFESQPGLVLENLNEGEEPVGFNAAGVDINLKSFEECIINCVAAAKSIPPEIYKLSFSSNYSASQAAIIEFRSHINTEWANFGHDFCSKFYSSWLSYKIITKKINAEGYRKAFFENDLETLKAWSNVFWYGSIKPSTDMRKSVEASQMLIEQGLSTRAREARILTGTKFEDNVMQVTIENQQIAKMNDPIKEYLGVSISENPKLEPKKPEAEDDN